jgi:hypothetical protein
VVTNLGSVFVGTTADTYFNIMLDNCSYRINLYICPLHSKTVLTSQIISSENRSVLSLSVPCSFNNYVVSKRS